MSARFLDRFIAFLVTTIREMEEHEDTNPGDWFDVTAEATSVWKEIMADRMNGAELLSGRIGLLLSVMPTLERHAKDDFKTTLTNFKDQMFELKLTLDASLRTGKVEL